MVAITMNYCYYILKTWVQMNVMEKREVSIWIWFNNFLTSILFIYDNEAYLNA